MGALSSGRLPHGEAVKGEKVLLFSPASLYVRYLRYPGNNDNNESILVR